LCCPDPIVSMWRELAAKELSKPCFRMRKAEQVL
jgi:hypothetical protein